MRIRAIGVVLFFVLPLLAACSLLPAQARQPTATPTTAPPDNANMANPASVYCEDQGGTLDIRTAADGSQQGFCVFSDGSECDEWAYFRGECAAGTSRETVTPTPVERTDDPATTATPAYVPDPAALRDFDYEGWRTYTNVTYGFTVRHPEAWTLTEVTDPGDTMAGHRIDLTTPADPDAVLMIAFKSTSEDRRITPTGIGAGEIVGRGTLTFLDQPLSRAALVAEGKDMEILYGDGGEIVRGDTVFWIALHTAEGPMTDAGLSADIEAQADQIVEGIQALP